MQRAPGFWHRLDRILSDLRRHRQGLSLLLDGWMVALCWNATYLFRLGFERWVSARPVYDAWVMTGVVGVYLLVFLAWRVPRGMWRFSGFGEALRIAGACLAAGALCAIGVLMLRLQEVPRAVLALHPLLSLMGVCMMRMAYRMLYEHARARITGGEAEVRRAIVMGAGEAAKRLLAGIHEQGWAVLALLDDDPSKRGARIGGVVVRGPLAEVSSLALRAEATHVIVALPGTTAAQRRRAIEQASATGLPVLIVPSASELQDGRARQERVRGIEPEDLLGREPVKLDEAGVAQLICGKTVLVTGAGGSIGSELCRQVARYGPRRMVLFELGELALYQIEQQLGELHPHLPLVKLMGDVKAADQISRVCELHRPHLVLHAAACKHVPLMEDENAWAALQNNTLGTWYTALAAARFGAERFVLVSTDKAVNPSSVMGASKRAAEMLLSHLASQGHRTIFAAVRFGNVLGSSGSVIPKFKEQIAKGGPLTVTHPDITRYFMTLAEAARLVLQAAALAISGQVYVLDMGEPVRIVDLARDLIRLSGHRESEIGIVFSGLRPGEKLYEELLADADHTLASAHSRLRIAQLKEQHGEDWVEELVRWLETMDGSLPSQVAKQELQRLVPEYRAM